MLHKVVSILLMLMILMANLTGCGMDLTRGIIREYEDNKDNIKSELHELIDSLKSELSDWAASLGRHSLTDDDRLKGKRRFGEDEYAGSYEAEYDRFSGEEYIFGGTLAERDKGNTWKVTYSLKIRSGTAVLYWLGEEDDQTASENGEKHFITVVDAEDTCEFTFKPGENFIVLEGDDYTGSLSIKAE